MTPPEVEVFLAEISASLTCSFPSYTFEFLLRTPKALKVKVHLKKGLFIAVPFICTVSFLGFSIFLPFALCL